MENFLIRAGVREDIPQVMALVKELAKYERAPDEVTNTEEQMLRDGFGENPSFGLFVSVANSQIIGLAIFYTRYSTWKGRMLYLEDIIVTEAHRGQGIGGKLFEACINHAIDNNFAGMSWQVLEWNDPAIHFYQKYPCTLDKEWINGKMDKNQILEFKKK